MKHFAKFYKSNEMLGEKKKTIEKYIGLLLLLDMAEL